MNRARILVLTSIALLALLGGTVGVRLLRRGGPAKPGPAPARLARWTEKAPAATVPAPKPIDVAGLKVPCWGCPDAEGWPVAFRTDLDLLAPLGTGPGNAGAWFKDFTAQVGAREDEAEESKKRRGEGPGEFGKVLPPDDPLLREAEAWADQSTMRFYPDTFAMEGFRTRIPNLLLAMSIGKSWAARAALHPDSPAALDDCRRAIRWGRLLRQEDATILGDLVGIACIRLGAEQMYEIAVRRGDHPLALASAIVLGEHAPQRLRTARLLTRTETTAEGTTGAGFEVTGAKVKAIVDAAKGAPGRRFRLEAICQLSVVRTVGGRGQRREAEAALVRLSKDSDPLVSSLGRWVLSNDLDRSQLEGSAFPSLK